MNKNSAEFIAGRVYQRVVEARLSNKFSVIHGISSGVSIDVLIDCLFDLIPDASITIKRLSYGYQFEITLLEITFPDGMEVETT